jgi:hypothetical protein
VIILLAIAISASPASVPTRQLLVKPIAGVGDLERDAWFRRAHVDVVSRHFARLYLVRAASVPAAVAAQRLLAQSRRFAYAELDMLTQRTPAHVPNDTLVSQEWHLDNIGAQAAWDLAQGDPSVIIAVIDTGVQASHPDLQAKIVAPYDAINDVEGTAEPDPGVESAHGTACAGIAAASTDNALGVAAICPKCAIMPIKLVRPGGWAATSADVRAFEHAWKNGAAVISNSWGAATEQPVPAALEDAIHEAATSGRGGKGAVVIFAAGNGYRQNAAEELPSLDTVLAVGASTPDDHRADYSNYGPFVPLLAPAAAYSTDLTGMQGFAPGDYVTSFDGTSAAAPIVAGIAGVLVALNPQLTAQQVKAVLLSTADKVQPVDAQYDASGRSKQYGFGRVSMLKAVRAVQAGQVCQPNPEVCGNGIDDDCNGLVDDLDPACAATCTSSAQCAADKVCVRGHCAPKVAPGSSIGAACATSAACGAQASCLSGDDYPGGYCTLACDGGAPCPTGAGCVVFGAAGGHYCLALCHFNGDCRDGYACGGDGVCVPACADDAACGAGKVCVEGRCIDAPLAAADAADPSKSSATNVSVRTAGCRCGSGAGGPWIVLLLAAALTRRRSARRAKR